MSLNQYKVYNLIEDVAALRVLLILESPYINEYIHQHPAAGDSALELTQFLIAQGYLKSFDAQLPIGCNIKKQNYKPLGILNCSTLPLNKVFYPCALSSDDLSQVNELAAIKQSLDQSNQQQLSIDLLASDVFKDFTGRLTQVLEQAPNNIIIVPCGDTATGFMEAFKTIYHQSLTVLDSLPHPTEPKWQEEITSITRSNTLIKAVPPQTLP